MSERASRSEAPLRRQSSALAFLTVLLILVAAGETMYIYILRMERDQKMKTLQEAESELTNKTSQHHVATQEHKEFSKLVGYEFETISGILQEAELPSLRAFVEKLQLQFKEQGLTIASLEQDLQKQKDEVTRLEKDRNKLDEEVASLRKELDAVRAKPSEELEKLRSEVGRLSTDLANQKVTSGELRGELTEVKRDRDNKELELSEVEAVWQQKEEEALRQVSQWEGWYRKYEWRLRYYERILAGNYLPSGHVVAADMETGVVRIDLGEEEGVRSKMRFEVRENKNVEPGAFKGFIEVTNVYAGESVGNIIPEETTKTIEPGDLVLERGVILFE